MRVPPANIAVILNRSCQSRSCKVMTNSPLGKMQWESTSEILAAFGDDEGGANLDYYHRRTPFATLARVSP
ncbi:hypothetical protein Plhal304r1_c025g0085561 [Plasmopara halstedii]